MATLKKIPQDSVVSGVCAGIAYNMGIKTIIVRIIYALFVFSSLGLALIVYILLSVFLDSHENKPENYEQLNN